MKILRPNVVPSIKSWIKPKNNTYMKSNDFTFIIDQKKIGIKTNIGFASGKPKFTNDKSKIIKLLKNASLVDIKVSSHLYFFECFPILFNPTMDFPLKSF